MASTSALVVNSGSSNVKFGLFELSAALRELRRGTFHRTDNEGVIQPLLNALTPALRANPLAAVGHRIVHGGPHHLRPCAIDDAMLDDLRTMVDFAPNHLPAALALIEQARSARPDVPHVACFDTGFYAQLPELSRRLPLPRKYDAQGVRRYGFHGLAYAGVIDELHRRGVDAIGARVVMAHLGSGSSMTAVRDGLPIDTSMGMTPIGGLVMSTRAGDLDPGVVTYLMRTTNMSADQLEHLLSHAAGLTAISGTTGDMQALLAAEADDSDAHLAVAVYCYEAKKRLGAYIAALGGVDHVTFSGGIGEHAPLVRQRICDGLSFAGVTLDPTRNDANAPTISPEAASVTVHVIAADEERVIARAVRNLLSSSAYVS